MSRFGSEVGDYELTLVERLPPIAAARPVTAGTQADGMLSAEATEEWWRIEAQAGRTYVFETTPAGDLDTVITLYEGDGRTEIDSDDDGGTGFGSRLTVENTTARTLLLKVTRYRTTTGTYRLLVTSTAP